MAIPQGLFIIIVIAKYMPTAPSSKPLERRLQYVTLYVYCKKQLLKIMVHIKTLGGNISTHLNSSHLGMVGLRFLYYGDGLYKNKSSNAILCKLSHVAEISHSRQNIYSPCLQ